MTKDEITTKINKVLSKFDWDIEERIFAELSLPIYADMIKRRGSRAARLIGGEFEVTEAVKKFIESKALKFASDVNATTKEKIKTALKEGIDEGDSIAEISGRLAEVFKIRTGAETERIARTEVLSAHNEADIEAYKQSSVVEKKEWLATLDDRTRDSHAEIDGEIVGLDETFSNGLQFPGDPSGDASEIVNCRCTNLPVLSD